MRGTEKIALLFGVLAIGIAADAAKGQPGHAPFVFAPFEIENYERALVPNGVLGATVVFDGVVPGFHPAAVAAGQPSVPYKTGAPIYLEDSASAYEQFGGILGHVGPNPIGPTNYENIFPGGTTVSPAYIPNGGESRNSPISPSYNGTKLSLVTRTDANAADDVAITSGNQALRVSMLNVSQGDGDTSFDRPASLIIKANDLWGVADSRFDTFETVRADPSQYSVSIDVTFLANEIPDMFTAVGPFIRLGFISNHGGIFDESPPNILQGPPTLLFGNVDEDGDGLANFTDPTYVDPDNPDFLPGEGVAGVIQRRYVFPASAMDWPANPLAGVPDPADGGRRVETGGLANAYAIGFVFNGGWALNQPASFIVDNFRFIPRNPIDHADFNDDNLLNVLDWQILIANLNSQTANMFSQGDIGSHPEEGSVSPGVVDFQDFVRFEEIWDANQGAGAFKAFLAGNVPEPSSLILIALCGAAIAFGRGRRGRRNFRLALLAFAIMVSASSTASAQLADTLLFGFEPPPDPNLQRWVPAGDAANPDMPPVLTTSAMGATQGSTRGLSITQNGSPFSWDAAVSIFGGEEGLPAQQMAFNNALDVGANHFVLEMDVVYKDASIPDTSFVNMSVRLSAGSTSTDEVHSLAVAGDGTGPIPDQVIPVSIPLSIDPPNTGDSVLSVPQSSATAGFYNMTLAFNGDWGPAPATFFVDNIRLRQVTPPNLLTLEVNRATGAATLKNLPGAGSGNGPVVFDYYEITSASESNAADYNNNGKVDAADYVIWRKTLNQAVPANTAGDGNGDGMVTTADYTLWRTNFDAAGSNPALNPAGWNSLDAQNIDALDGPDAGTVAGDSLLEGWDKSGSPSTTVLSEAFLNGNSTFDPNESRPLGNIFTPGGSQNLVLRFREPSRPGFLRTGLVTYVGGSGSSLGLGAAVPEPQSFVLALIPGILALEFRSPRRAEKSRSLPGRV
jgi:hypothetical protein